MLTFGVEPKKSLVSEHSYNFELRHEFKLFYLQFSGIILVSIDKTDLSENPKEAIAF
jgi:hypothetical protein